MKRPIVIVLALAAVMLYPPGAAAQYDIPHGVMGCGGGHVTGSHQCWLTVGQTGVGIAAGSHMVKSGFWFVADVSSTVDVAFAAFEGDYDGEIVRLRWEVSADTPFYGFNIYRTDEEAGETTRLNDEPLPADAGCVFDDVTAIPGRTYHYQVGALLDGGETWSVALTVELPPKPLTLYQNFPNPFNPTTSVAFFLPAGGPVTLRVYDVGGRLVRTLVDAAMPVGRHVAEWNGRNDRGAAVSSGVYYYRLHANKKTITKKMVVLR